MVDDLPLDRPEDLRLKSDAIIAREGKTRRRVIILTLLGLTVAVVAMVSFTIVATEQRMIAIEQKRIATDELAKAAAAAAELARTNDQLAALDKELAAKSAALKQLSADSTINLHFTAFLHYRDDVPYSQGLAESARQALVNAGFKVILVKSTDVRVRDKPGQNAEGPHIDWFQEPGEDIATVNDARDAAERVAAILNGIKPAELAPFTVKPDGWPAGSGSSQVQYLGVWF
jgi:hypothetical protein